jgi:hypothetical protein
LLVFLAPETMVAWRWPLKLRRQNSPLARI